MQEQNIENKEVIYKEMSPESRKIIKEARERTDLKNEQVIEEKKKKYDMKLEKWKKEQKRAGKIIIREADYPRDLRGFLEEDKVSIRFTTKELDVLVMDYQECHDQELFNIIFENYIDLTQKTCKKYQDKMHLNKIKTYSSFVYEDDLRQEALLILYKCLNRYKIYENKRSSFSSYYIGELRNHCIETCRQKYFNVVKVPSTEYRSYRKAIKDNATTKSQAELGMVQRTNACISDYNDATTMSESFMEEEKKFTLFFDSLDANQNILNILHKYIPKKENVMIFCMVYGIGCSTYKSSEIADYIKMSKPAISKRLKKMRETLATAPEVLDLLKYYKENKLLEKK